MPEHRPEAAPAFSRMYPKPIVSLEPVLNLAQIKPTLAIQSAPDGRADSFAPVISAFAGLLAQRK